MSFYVTNPVCLNIYIYIFFSHTLIFLKQIVIIIYIYIVSHYVYIYIYKLTDESFHNAPQLITKTEEENSQGGLSPDLNRRGLTCPRSKGAQFSQLSPNQRERKSPLAPLEAFRLAETFKLVLFSKKVAQKDPPSFSLGLGGVGLKPNTLRMKEFRVRFVFTTAYVTQKLTDESFHNAPQLITKTEEENSQGGLSPDLNRRGLTCPRSKGAQFSQLSPNQRERKTPLAPLEAFRLAETFKLVLFSKKVAQKDPPSTSPFFCGAPACSSVEAKLDCEKLGQKATRICGGV